MHKLNSGDFDQLNGCRRNSLRLALVVALVTFGCDSSEPESDDRVPSQVATFEATIAGDIEMDISGAANAIVQIDRWSVQMSVISEGRYYAITLLRNAGVLLPQPGTYTIGGSAPMQDFSADVRLAGTSFSAEPAGTLVITVSTPLTVRGTFDFTAAATMVAQPTVVNISGGFNARNHAQTQ